MQKKPTYIHQFFIEERNRYLVKKPKNSGEGQPNWPYELGK